MKVQTNQRDWWFLLVCLVLGVLAELSFFHSKIGISFLIFIAGFYAVVFFRFPFSFTHRRIGILIMLSVWMLAAGYLLYDNTLFQLLNLIIIPVLVYFHIVLITSPNSLKWSTPGFVLLLSDKLGRGFKYSYAFCSKTFRQVFRNMDDKTAQIIKRILIGLVIGAPLLLFITFLLMSADAVFQDLVLRLPTFLLQLNFMEGITRALIIIFCTLLFFGVFQVLRERPERDLPVRDKEDLSGKWDSITALTILILLNAVYVLFVVIQFTYFFSDGLQDGLTYAEYARRGFFELIIVTLINWTILISFLKLVHEPKKQLKLTIKLMYTLLIILSGVMLLSAYQRLSMYEAAYGFTMDRILAHAFMIFLMVIFAYTFIRVWVERLSLLHFYLIMGLVFYTALNVIHLEEIIVDKNLERYESTEKIDIHYLNQLSYTGIEGLIRLYEQEPDYPGLATILQDRKEWVRLYDAEGWQSYNFTKQKVTQELLELDLKKQEGDG